MENNFFNLIRIEGYNKQITIDLNRQNFQTYYDFSKIYKPEDCYLNDRNFEYPSIISDAYIIIAKTNNLSEEENFIKIIKLLEFLQCKFIVLSFELKIELSTLKKMLDIAVNHNIHEIHLLFSFSPQLHSDEFGEIIFNSKRIKRINIYNSPFNKNYNDLIFYLKTSKRIGFKKFKDGFNINHLLYSESLSAHTYFNRKLYIGNQGEVKNAKECNEIYGNINNSFDLKNSVLSPEFQKYWFVKKEETDVCKDCEFRHMCVDNRLPYERNQNEWYHKIECNYNPYIAKWEDEEGYRILVECGVISNENGFSIDHEKIAEINKELWEEVTD